MDPTASPHALINKLPPELLVSILLKVTCESYELKPLALVCRSWRDIVMGTGELWNHISVSIYTDQRELSKQLELSGEALLVLDLQDPVDGLRMLASAWNGPNPIIERVSSLEGVIVDIEDDTDGNSLWRPLSDGDCWPQLRKLELMVATSEAFDLHLRAPNLESLNLDLNGFHDWSYIGLGSALCDVKWTTRTVDMSAFARGAAQCPNLRRLEITTNRLEVTSPGIPIDTPLWPKLACITLKCGHAALMDILAILFNAPQLAKLELRLDILAPSDRRILSHFQAPSSLHELLIDTIKGPDDDRGYMLGSELLEGILDLYDPAALKIVDLANVTIPSCSIPASCSQLQEIHLVRTVVPQSFIDCLKQCPLLCCVTVYGSRTHDITLSTSNEDIFTTSLAFDSGTFPGTLLESLHLHDVAVCPEFVAHLTQHPQLSVATLVALSVNTAASTSVARCPDIDSIIPLPALSLFAVGIGPVDDTPPPCSLINPESQYIVSAAIQLSRRMASGQILLSMAPLQTTDVGRFLLQSNRTLSDVTISFKSHESNPDTLGLMFEAYSVGDVSPGGEREPLTLIAGIKRIELVDVADIILNRFPLDSDLRTEWLDEVALDMAQMASERNPSAVGLQRLLPRAQTTTSDPDDIRN